MPKITSNNGLSLKQRKWIKEYIETGNATEAAMRVYKVKDRASAGSIGTENLQKLALPELMEEMGLTDVALVNIGTEGMTKPVKQSITGEVHPDYTTRHRYWDTMLRLKRKLGTGDINIQANEGSKVLIMSSELIDKYEVSPNPVDSSEE